MPTGKDPLPWTELLPSPDSPQAMPARMRDAFAYWHWIRQGKPMPAQTDLDPLDISLLLPNTILVDVTHLPVKSWFQIRRKPTPLDFQFRLIGTDIARRSAHDYTGKRFADIPHMAVGTPFWHRHEEVVRKGRPHFSAVSYVGPDREVRSCHVLLAPMSQDGSTVNLIFSFVSFGVE
jgi:hypothetical protein